MKKKGNINGIEYDQDKGTRDKIFRERLPELQVLSGS